MTTAEVIVIISLAVIAYTYVGYPVVLGLVCLVRRKPVGKAPGAVKSVSIVVCVHNGEKLVGKRIQNLVGQRDPSSAEREVRSADSGVRCPSSAKATAGRQVSHLRQGYGGQAGVREEEQARQSPISDIRYPKSNAEGNPISDIRYPTSIAERGAGRNLPTDYEVVIASDGSTDGTVALLTDMKSNRRQCHAVAYGEGGLTPINADKNGHKEAQKGANRNAEGNPSATLGTGRQPCLRIVEFSERRGKAAALNDVIPQCKGEIVVLTDVRQEFAPDAVETLLENFADEKIGAVSGELVFRRADSDSAAAEGLDVYWRMEKMLRKMESCVDSTNGCTGAIYAIRRELFKPIDPTLVLDDVAIPMLILKQGKRVMFDERAKAYDEPSQEFVTEHRRKVRTLGGNFQLCRAYPWLLNPFKNRIWFQFVSHKMMRLLCPWALLLFFAASIPPALKHTWGVAILIGQCIFYMLALLGVLLRKMRIPRLLSLPSGFVLLNWAAVVGLAHFCTGKLKGHWPSE